MAPVHHEMQRWQATVEQYMPHLTSRRSGLVELRDGFGPLVRADDGQ